MGSRAKRAAAAEQHEPRREYGEERNEQRGQGTCGK
jgi:hypothetical protein